MKKLSSAIFAIALLFSSAAMALTKTATITISGTIPESCTLTLGLNGNTVNVNLTVPQTDLNVGTITTRCNSLNGYSLSVDTANASKMKAAGATPPVPYTINLVKTQGSAINSGGYFPSDSNSLDISPILDTSDQKANILLKTANGTSYPGTYSDTLTFTLTTL